MALSTEVSQRELARAAGLCYEGRRIRVSLAFLAAEGYTSESNATSWDSIKLSGNGYADYTVTLATGSYDSVTDNRYELPVVSAPFTGSGSGFTATHFYAVLGSINTKTINNVALTTNVATITTSAAHGFSTGNTVTIAGLTNTVFNGTYTIASTPLSTTFTFSRTNANITSVADSGTATVVTEETSIMQLGTFSPSEVWSAGQTKTIEIPISVDN
jgi:hypothetical protein